MFFWGSWTSPPSKNLVFKLSNKDLILFISFFEISNRDYFQQEAFSVLGTPSEDVPKLSAFFLGSRPEDVTITMETPLEAPPEDPLEACQDP